jgi:predicted amidohydrolase
VKITAVSYSLSSQPPTLNLWKENLIHEIRTLISEGSKVILYPELFLMGLSDYFLDLTNQLSDIANYILNDLLPSLELILNNTNVLLVLGSGPKLLDNQFYNSTPIWNNGIWFFQDKIHLTPWEVDFIYGSEIKIFSYNGLKTAIVICFDIEQPGLALKLKEEGVHFILVPSATINRNGNQRVNRCASSRSVELGAAILTVPLIGNSKCELVDHNEGRQGFFLPSQELVIDKQEQFSNYSLSEKIIAHYELDVELIKELKIKNAETKPYLTKDLTNIKLIMQI